MQEVISLESSTPAVADQDLVPITANQRIEALDVVRGFALLGIFLMNVEYFNRTLSSLGEGMPRGLTGIDWLASWFIAYFVQGKFWTIFLLPFGMGFAVMMTRREVLHIRRSNLGGRPLTVRIRSASESSRSRAAHRRRGKLA